MIFILYNLFLYPLFLLITFFLSLFNSKIRRGVRGRFETNNKLKKYFNQDLSSNVIYWFHAVSYGEYLQVEPVLEGIKKKGKNSIILMSFFSPSGYDNVNNQNIDCKVYIPFDFYWTMQNVLDIVKPKKIIFATADLWYNLIWLAKNRNIDTPQFTDHCFTGDYPIKPVDSEDKDFEKDKILHIGTKINN